jgi:hypothetical protein
MNDFQHQTGLFATSSLGSFWWVADVLYRHGPTWSVVPPVLIGTATLIGAIRGYLNDRQVRRHAEEKHRAEMAAGRMTDQPQRHRGTEK